jgi:Cu/Ag efflux pump CusA
MNIPSTITSAYSGIQTQTQRMDKNVAEVASVEASSGRDSSTQDRALVEQIDIINSLQANARSLEAASDRIGTLLDIKV